MLSQLALSFPKIEKEILSRIYDYCNGDLNEANELLNFVTDNRTSIEQQRKLLTLLEDFSVHIDKETILKKWVECGQIYLLTMLELNKICKANTKKYLYKVVCELKRVYRVEESKETKIIKELCLHVLWNLLSNPKKLKYRQISNSLLFRNVKKKCEEMKVEMDPVLEIMRHYLKEFGFQNKIDGNWSYRGSVPSLSLWKHYCEWIKKQLMLCILHFNCHLIFKICRMIFVVLLLIANRYKTNRCTPKTVFMCSKGKWTEYEIVFDYQHRTIMLLNKINEEKDEKEEQDKFKIEALQVGNPKEVVIGSACLYSMEFNSFNVSWEDDFIYKVPLNPYAATFENAKEYLKDKLEMIEFLGNGTGELINCDFLKVDCQISLLLTGKAYSCTNKKAIHENIKQQIQYNESDINALILNDKILTILMMSTDTWDIRLNLHHICAILLYCGKSCGVEFSYDQMDFKHYVWIYLDRYLQSAVAILCTHERREESNMDLYCELKGMKFENINELSAGYFVSYVSATNVLQDTQTSQTDQRCILHFHPSMRRADGIFSCNVSWILPFKHCHIIFSRPYTNVTNEYKTVPQWYPRVESENDNTQVILLTSRVYDRVIRPAMKICTLWNYSIDINLVGLLLRIIRSTSVVTSMLLSFDEWKRENNKEEQYTEKIDTFVKRRCCNHQINMFSIFFAEKMLYDEQKIMKLVTVYTVIIGLPFVEADKQTWMTRTL
ncbi:hypothetical protein RFI_30177 [Reticulomyxa filosa]|uniref:CUE domain-containing protein n=1 Tax=Reticulomyxa filosa TaxID=46433 RepID=X6M1B2_RETFI|nr:hypothetical protein RFI_30177 [Reticulomyxa filosa]|eukprot:ETO07217.1 hypothetical protein RFI_30177 [Reticulomyxa filosa]